MPIRFDRLKSTAMQSWYDTVPGPLRFPATYSLPQQLRKEAAIDELMRREKLAIEYTPRLAPADKLLSVRDRVQKAIIQLLHTFECVIDNDTEQRFSRITDAFIRQAFDFDPTISEEAVYQAARNVMIMNTFQLLLGKKIALTPSVFAYSLLYPYTDNYLDAVDVGDDSKRDFNAWLGERLQGSGRKPHCRHEEIVGSLVAMIEEEFDRRAFPSVYESLRGIHDAQQLSLRQQNSGGKFSPGELLEMSTEKGGASVVADGYLVAGMLAPEELEFIFNFGVVLQLIDDLQDLEEDLAHRHRTLPGLAAEDSLLEAFTDRLLGFLADVMNSSPGMNEKARKLMDRGCRFLVMEAVAMNCPYYSEEYLRAAEQFSPTRLQYLRSMRIRLQERKTAIPSAAEAAISLD